MSLAGPVAVTGPLGFVGSRLVPRLVAAGVHVIAVVRPGRDAARLERAGAEVRRAELSAAVHASVWEGARSWVHLAGMALVPPLVPGLEQAGVARAVCVSSAGVHTRLPSPSAEAKREGERSLRAARLDGVIVRPSMIYGAPGDRNMERLLSWILRCPVVPLPGGGDTLQQPVHVDDLVEAIVQSLERPEASGGVFDVGGPEALPLRELVRKAARALGRRAWIVPVPLAPVHIGVVSARRLGLGPSIRPEQILRLRESKAVDIAPARRILGFEPRSFEAGIEGEVRQFQAR